MKSLLLLLLSFGTAFCAEENFTYRVTGLFAPEREAVFRETVAQLPEVKLVSVDFANAEAVFAFDPAVAFKDAKPDKIVQRLNELVGSKTRNTLGIATVLPTAKDKLARIEIDVGGCDCKACGLAAYESIFNIDGVAAAIVSFRDGKLTALIDPEKTGRAALEAALKKRNVSVRPTPTPPH